MAAFEGQMKLELKGFTAVLVAGLFSLPVSAAEEEKGWELRGSIYADRAANESEEGFANRLELQPRFGGGLDANRSFDLGDGQSAGISFGVATERYPDNDSLNRVFFKAGAEHATALRMGMLRQFRVFVEFTHAVDDHSWVYNRARVGAALRFQPAPRNMVQLRSRVGYRDQNDDHTFRGYDQTEFMTDLMHNWRTADNLWRTTSILYYERRNADSDVYSYDEGGLRLIGRRLLVEDVNLIGRTALFARDYDAGAREDRYLRSTLGIEWQFWDRATIEAFGGYQRNSSTIARKDYGGGIFGVALSKTF